MKRFLAILSMMVFFGSAPMLAFATEAPTNCTDYYCVCGSTGSAMPKQSSTPTTTTACNDFCFEQLTSSYRLSCDTADGKFNQPIGQGNIASPATAATTTQTATITEPVKDYSIPTLGVDIPGFKGFSSPYKDGDEIIVNFLGEYVNAVYTWLLGAAALVAVVMMMIGGLQYVLARGKSKYIEAAKTRITNAITGLVLLLAAYNIAYLIDPNTTSLTGLGIKNVPLIESDLAAQGGEETGSDITPNDLPINAAPISGDHISYTGSASNKFADIEVVAALQKAAVAFYKATGKNVTVTDGSRTITKQATMYYNNCIIKGSCSPITCDPSYKTATTTGTESAVIASLVSKGKTSNCPHTSFVAIDAWGGPRPGNFKNDIELQQKLITAMIDAGFCRLSKEVWHFELDTKKVSKSSCSKTWNTTSYMSKKSGVLITPPSTCKVWQFNANDTNGCITAKG